MSQQTNAGFNAPGFSVVADDPGVVVPSAFAMTCSDVMQLRGPPFIRAFIAMCAAGDLLSSFATGVGHSAITCAHRSGDLPRSTSVRAPSGVRIDLSAEAVAVGQRARPVRMQVAASDFDCCEFPCSRYLCSLLVGVGHKPESVTPMGRIDGTSRDNGRPAGVADAFQVSEHSVEPVLANRRRNLLSHEDSGPSGTNESKKVGPQVPIVSLRFALAGDRERLARRGAGPELAIVGPAGQASGEGPAPDSGEKMTLPKLSQISRGDTRNASFIHFSVRNQTCGNQIA
jgi:hypothetical protein